MIIITFFEILSQFVEILNNFVCDHYLIFGDINSIFETLSLFLEILSQFCEILVNVLRYNLKFLILSQFWRCSLNCLS